MNSNNCMVRANNYYQIMNVTSSLEGINSFLIHILQLVNFLKYVIYSCAALGMFISPVRLLMRNI